MKRAASKGVIHMTDPSCDTKPPEDVVTPVVASLAARLGVQPTPAGAAHGAVEYVGPGGVRYDLAAMAHALLDRLDKAAP